MTRMSVSRAVSACAALLATLATATPAVGGAPKDGTQPLTYSQARAAGLPVPSLPSETGVASCPTTADTVRGYRTATQAQAALEAYEARWGEVGPGRCQLDPRGLLYLVRPTNASQASFETAELSGFQLLSECSPGGTHFRFVLTQHCSINIQGARAIIEVGNPTMPCHLCTQAASFHAYVKAYTEGGNLMTSGWMEDSALPNAQYPASTFNAVTTYDPNTDLIVGDTIIFRVRHDGTGGAAGTVVAEYFAAGEWRVIDSRSSIWCMDTDGGGNCSSEHGVQAYSASDSWFDLNAPAHGKGINFFEIMLRNDPNDWKKFSPANYSESDTTAQSPYLLCALTNWYEFRASRSSC